ncbi:MAG: type I restriction enzyme HsdR N-terminal domain-containing protein [Lachnospiraceae bacterium]|nr:type I restriction enzyme HsdR N-terminal domain-containing protein [Lachnospiraceae bacterium]
MDILIKDLKHKLKMIQDKTESEENLKIHVTKWLLEELGYNPDDIDYEYKLCRRGKDRHADIYIPIKEKALFVETKKYSKSLDADDVRQLIEYLSMNSVMWGILTNGRQYYLINNAIDIHRGDGSKDILNKVVLYVEIGIGESRARNERYLKYFSKENIFDKMTTNFYRDIAQFFAWQSFKNAGSQSGYINTLYNFFDYYINAGHDSYITGYRDDALALENVTEQDVIDFFKATRPNGRPWEGGNHKTKCSHIRTMFDVLYKAKYIRDNKMGNLLERAKKEFADTTVRERDIEKILTHENISIIMEWLEGKKSYNKLLIFILCAYYGFDRTTIIDFCSQSWDVIDFAKHSFKFNGKTYPLVTKLEYVLMKMKQEYAEERIKAKWIYVKKYNGSYTPININVINGLFKDGIHKLQIGETDWSAFNVQTIRASLFIRLYEAGCSLEEISYLTGAPVSSILQPEIINEDMIKRAGEKSWKNGTKSGQSKHPFNEIFNS